MNDGLWISSKKLEDLAQELAKTFSLDEEEAMGLVYEEWDLVEDLFHSNATTKTIHSRLMEEINYTYRIA
jgi:hypothetical protein